jgi:hypothetical protein
MASFQFRATNVPDHFIRHRNFLGELTRHDGPRNDFNFTIVGRGGQGRVALRSMNFPDRFLRHRDFRIHLEGPAGGNDTLFTQDSTFVMVRGLADPGNPNTVSFRSVNFPDRYLRHRNFSLFLEPRDSPSLAPDATFIKEPAAVLIDEGA